MERTISTSAKPTNGSKKTHTDPSVVRMIETSLEDDKAEDVIVIDLTGKSTIADYMVVATGRSARQVGAMADHLVTKLKGIGYVPTAEGMAQGDWVLLDAGDVVIHLFRPEVRAFYGLEKMWGEVGKVTPSQASLAANADSAPQTA